MNTNSSPRLNLAEVARRLMLENGFTPTFPADVTREVAGLDRHAPAITPSADVRDLRGLLWSSIDNEMSRDLDQLEVAERLPDGTITILVAIADVDAYVPKGSAIDRHAASQTTTVYTGVGNFPMLPEALSTAATSLQEGHDKLAVVVELLVETTGHIRESTVYRAVVRNRAQLTYDAVGAWLDQRGPAPPPLAASADLQEQLRLQDAAAQALRKERYRHGALNIETIDTRPTVRSDHRVVIESSEKNRATMLIEDVMIAANEAVARLLAARHVSSIRRIVRTPHRWDRIVALAAALGARLPAIPDSRALNEFLIARQSVDPEHFPDLSLAVIKLMGPGEYILERPGDPGQGHFGLAVDDYTHSTAPNRRFANLVTQRLLKALLANQPPPYADAELASIASTCTVMASNARKVERRMSKRMAAVAMAGRIGESFDAIVTGVTPRGTFVRLIHPHAEGLLAHGQGGVDVGDKLRVRLVRTDEEQGFIDFART